MKNKMDIIKDLLAQIRQSKQVIGMHDQLLLTLADLTLELVEKKSK